MKIIAQFFILSVLVTVAIVNAQHCNVQETDEGSVCVCNTKYCDSVPDLDVTSGKYQLYTTSKATLGFYSRTGSFGNDSDKQGTLVVINQTQKYQDIIGFGGAFTDSTGINIKLLPEEAQNKLIRSYFGSGSIEYSLCRVPIGGTDFSTRGYSYDDVEDDATLEHFALQEDDFNYKIPFIQQANSLSSSLKLFSSAWSAPKWMKTNNDWAGTGFLKEEFYQLWADYYIKFYQEYEKNNITFWGTTTQNEPYDGLLPKSLVQINNMGWLPSQMNKWLSENLGPTIRNSKYKDLKIMLHDDIRLTLPLLLLTLDNEEVMAYADGVAVHWYTNFFIPPTALDLLKTDKKDWFFISSEASNGYLKVLGLDTPIRKGSWKRGEDYVNDILDNLEKGAGGWVDWNMVLDETGGPTYISNFIDSPILVNETLEQFYKQPIFYAMGHFSKFVIPGSVRLETSLEEELENVRVMAFLRPDNLTALIIFNSNESKVNVQIEDNSSKSTIIEIEAKSINTVLYQ